MSARARAVLDEFARTGGSDAFDAGFHALLEDAPGEVPTLVNEGMERGLERVLFLGDAVSFLPPDALPDVIGRALAARDRPETRPAADEVLSHAALQFPRLFHPRLTEIFERGIDGQSDDHSWPWRESGELHHAYLLRVAGEPRHPFLLRLAGKRGRRARGALKCLLETRTPAAFQAALRHAHVLPGGVGAHLHAVGYEPADGGGWRALYPADGYHLRFPDGYRDHLDLAWHLRIHPTWRLEAEDAAPARFGGAGRAACAVCGGEAHHLLTLDPVPAGLGVTSVSALTLEVCFRCVWFNPELWWKHDQAGRPAPHPGAAGEPEEDPWGGPLREAEVRLVPTPARWRWQDWGVSNGRENLVRLGGHPCWVQEADYPRCPECGRTMAFLLQVEAALPAEDGGYAIDDGILYTFWCDACRVSVSLHQQT